MLFSATKHALTDTMYYRMQVGCDIEQNTDTVESKTGGNSEMRVAKEKPS